MRSCQTACALLFLPLAIAASTEAFAVTDDQKQALRANCRGDFIAHCRGVSPGGVEAFQCLAKNSQELSSACHAAVKDVDPDVK
ncbi:hypothetical protein K1W69_11335 [Hoeflea sp. WL0058]|uniref:Cysteine rich repeat-containing protein n=1 Tax=Flavimaribacter sediminis TaxID=2865987 RepID=A0AAE2ZKD2_9HYPH|nr:hypothetical protein [Flavimaribacter sediminis]MBW8637781.1 hypothetical protein [Flavimaribacter sediminis]